MSELLKKCLVEFIGAFFLVLTVGMTVFARGAGFAPPIAIGFMLMVMVYAGGHISGGHYNPAVSLAAAIRGALPWKDFAPYCGAQLLGGVIAALVAGSYVTVPSSRADFFNIWTLVVLEFLFTFALCYVVLHTATAKNNQNNSFYGLAIGGTVTAAAFATIGQCYGAFNPAIALGLITMGVATLKALSVTFVVNLVAGSAAGLVYKITNNDSDNE